MKTITISITIASLLHTIQIQNARDFYCVITKVTPEALAECLNGVQETNLCRRIFGEIGDLCIHKYKIVNLNPLKKLKISSVSF